VGVGFSGRVRKIKTDQELGYELALISTCLYVHLEKSGIENINTRLHYYSFINF